MFGTSILLTSCNLTKGLKESEYLYNGSKLKLNEDENSLDRIAEKRLLKQELEDIVRQEENGKALGVFKFKLWAHNSVKKGGEKGFKKWWKYQVGQPPVIYDSTQTQTSSDLMEGYLYNQGYYYGKVEHESIYNKKRAKAIYHVTTNDRYFLDSVNFPKPEGRINQIAYKYADESLLKKGEPYRVDDFIGERTRITRTMRNEGYFDFIKNYIVFDVDSNKTTRQLDIDVKIEEPSDSTRHEIYYINDVFIRTDFKLSLDGSTIELDTIVRDEFHIIFNKLKYRENTVLNSVFFKKDRQFRIDDERATINRLSELGVFRFVNVGFKKLKRDGENYLDVFINLTPNKTKQHAVEVEANTHSDYILGSALSYTYTNRNLFRGADLLVAGVSGGIAFTDLRFKDANIDSIVNTLDFSAKADLFFPKFLIPFSNTKFYRTNNPKTKISALYNYQRRVGFYTINSTDLSFGYTWNESKKATISATPIFASFLQLIAEPKFFPFLSANDRLRNSFEDQFIIGGRASYNYSNQEFGKNKDNFTFRATTEFAGNLLSAGYTIAEGKFPIAEDPDEIFKQNYSQYFRVDGDFRYYNIVDKKNTTVTRFYGGIGIPYGNSSTLPYVKQYYVGGTNDIRAWNVRELGPGADTAKTSGNSIFLDKTGDLKLEANFEYRFDIFERLKGAWFVDAGNVWTLRADDNAPLGAFKAKNFYKEIAVGTGLGARLDFVYFIIRFDAAFPLRDPSRKVRQRWVVDEVALGSSEWRKDNVVLNLAIGYPF